MYIYKISMYKIHIVLITNVFLHTKLREYTTFLLKQYVECFFKLYSNIFWTFIAKEVFSISIIIQ